MADAPALGAGEQSWGFKSLYPYQETSSLGSLIREADNSQVTSGKDRILRERGEIGRRARFKPE